MTMEDEIEPDTSEIGQNVCFIYHYLFISFFTHIDEYRYRQRTGQDKIIFSL